MKRFDGYRHLIVMLFGILKHFDSLRELEIGMKAEAHKLRHLEMDYLVRRSTPAEANIRRQQEFFAKVYAYLLEKYAKFLADSRPPKSHKGRLRSHYLLKEVHLPKDSTLAMDRGYIDIAQFQRLTEEGVCYVTKMKKNLNYKVLFTRGGLTHEARRVEIFHGKKKPVVLLTNNFDFSVEDVSEIYRLRWAIESLYKQLK